jgi:integrase
MAEEERHKLDRAEVWDSWVPRFIEHRYGVGPEGTLERNRGKWRNIAAFLKEHAIYVPRQFSRQHAHDFIEWRQRRHPELGIYEVTKNTALHEIKLLRVVMFEAIASGFAASNPCARLGIKMDSPSKKPRITEKEHRKILKALEREPEWMRISYAIAWAQGCRFSETCVALADVDFSRNIIGFRTKGNKTHIAEFPLAPELVPLLQKLKRKGKTLAYEMPGMPGKAWWRFFKRNKLDHLCFHCTRVTFITRCYEAGIPRDMVMRLAGHTTTAAHEIYPRLTAGAEVVQSMRRLI